MGDLWGPWPGGNWSWKSGGVGAGSLVDVSEEATTEEVEAGGRWGAGGSGPSGGWEGGVQRGLGLGWAWGSGGRGADRWGDAQLVLDDKDARQGGGSLGWGTRVQSGL